MKKIAFLILTFALIMTLSACLNDPFPPNATATPTVAQTSASTAAATAIPTEAPTSTPTPEPTHTATPTPEPTPTPLAPLETLTSGTNIYAVGGAQGTIYFDLDCDGADEEITYSFTGYSGPVPADTINLSSPIIAMMNYDIYQCNLSVNGQPIIVQGEVMAGLILIGDIDASDSQFEIMIPEFGPSGDPQTAFVAYHGTAPMNIGKIYENPLQNLKIDGSGKITGKKRGMSLHTWFYDAVYELDGGLIKEIIENGLVLMNTEITAKIDLPLQVSPTDSAPAFTLAAGQSGTITYTDDDSWFCIETQDGHTGWFKLVDYFTINGLPATDVFDGLLMAD